MVAHGIRSSASQCLSDPTVTPTCLVTQSVLLYILHMSKAEMHIDSKGLIIELHESQLRLTQSQRVPCVSVLGARGVQTSLYLMCRELHYLTCRDENVLPLLSYYLAPPLTARFAVQSFRAMHWETPDHKLAPHISCHLNAI